MACFLKKYLIIKMDHCFARAQQWGNIQHLDCISKVERPSKWKDHFLTCAGIGFNPRYKQNHSLQRTNQAPWTWWETEHFLTLSQRVPIGNSQEQLQELNCIMTIHWGLCVALGCLDAWQPPWRNWSVRSLPHRWWGSQLIISSMTDQFIKYPLFPT